MDKKYIERPTKDESEKKESKKQKSIAVLIDKKYTDFFKSSVKKSGLSTVQFVISLANEYSKKHNMKINYIPMPDKCGRKEGYNK